MDQSVPYYRVLMEKQTLHPYPRASLPPEYVFRFYQPGDERAWSEIQWGAGHVKSLEAGLDVFRREFAVNPEAAQQRCLLVFDGQTTPVGAAALWEGMHCGRTLPRIHWVAVVCAHQGKGIAKAMLTRLMQLYETLGLTEPIFLSSQTWSYRAINIYRQFGFEPCLLPPDSDLPDPQYAENARLAWRIIDDKIASYRAR